MSVRVEIVMERLRANEGLRVMRDPIFGLQPVWAILWGVPFLVSHNSGVQVRAEHTWPLRIRGPIRYIFGYIDDCPHAPVAHRLVPGGVGLYRRRK